MIQPITIRPFIDVETVDLYYNDEYVSTLTENEFNQFRVDLVEAAIESGITGESGYTLIECPIDTDKEPRCEDIIIYCDGNLSAMPYAFSHVRRTGKKIWDLNRPRYNNVSK